MRRGRFATLGTVLALAAAVAGFGGLAETKIVEVIDPLFQLPAWRMAIPAEWSFEGTVLREAWRPVLVARASSADGLTGFQILPQYAWVSTSDSAVRQRFEREHETIVPYMRADSFVTTRLLSEIRPGATVIRAEPMPDSMRLIEEDLRRNRLYDMEQTTTRRHQRTTGARYRIGYEIDGHPIEEVIVAIMTSVREQRPGYLERTSVMITAARAPRGQFDAIQPQFVAIARSVVTLEAWTARELAFRRDTMSVQRLALAKPRLQDRKDWLPARRLKP